MTTYETWPDGRVPLSHKPSANCTLPVCAQRRRIEPDAGAVQARKALSEPDPLSYDRELYAEWVRYARPNGTWRWSTRDARV